MAREGNLTALYKYHRARGHTDGLFKLKVRGARPHVGTSKRQPSLLWKAEGGHQQEQGPGKRLPKTATPGQRGHSLGVGQADATPAGTGAAPRAFPPVLPSWGRAGHTGSTAAPRPCRKPQRAAGQALGAAPPTQAGAAPLGKRPLRPCPPPAPAPAPLPAARLRHRRHGLPLSPQPSAAASSHVPAPSPLCARLRRNLGATELESGVRLWPRGSRRGERLLVQWAPAFSIHVLMNHLTKMQPNSRRICSEQCGFVEGTAALRFPRQDPSSAAKLLRASQKPERRGG